MDGEPGSLWYADNSDNEHLPPDSRKRTLSLRVFLPPEEFDNLYGMILATRPTAVTAHSKVVIELFEWEVQAGLSEGIYPDEYGLLSEKDSGLAGTRARLDSIYVKIGEPVSSPEGQDDDLEPSRGANNSETAGSKLSGRIAEELKQVKVAVWVIAVVLVGAVLGRLF